MNESEVVRELSRRAAVPESTAGAVFQAVRDLVRAGAITQDVLRGSADNPLQLRVVSPELVLTAAPTDPTLVEDLIARARKHPLGVGFLLTGLLGSVAVALGAHAFTVEAARERLRKELQHKNESKEPFEA